MDPTPNHHPFSKITKILIGLFVCLVLALGFSASHYGKDQYHRSENIVNTFEERAQNIEKVDVQTDAKQRIQYISHE